MLMKHAFFFLTLAALIVAPFQMSLAAEPAYIGVVDVQKLLSESKAAKDMQTKVKKHQDKFVEELRSQEEELRKQEKALVDQRATLKPEDFAKKRKEFEEELIKTRRSAQENKRELDKAAGKALNKLRAEIFKVVEKISEEDGYNLILSRQNVILGANAIDISEETLKRLDKAVQSIPLEIKSN